MRLLLSLQALAQQSGLAFFVLLGLDLLSRFIACACRPLDFLSCRGNSRIALRCPLLSLFELGLDDVWVGRALAQHPEFRGPKLHVASCPSGGVLEALEPKQTFDVALALVGRCARIECGDVLL